MTNDAHTPQRALGIASGLVAWKAAGLVGKQLEHTRNGYGGWRNQPFEPPIILGSRVTAGQSWCANAHTTDYVKLAPPPLEIFDRGCAQAQAAGMGCSLAPMAGYMGAARWGRG